VPAHRPTPVGWISLRCWLLPDVDNLEFGMVRSASRSVLPSTYDDFLYAPVGESSNGALLTVLSVLARQNVDPWEAAADLTRLPQETAAQRLTSMIAASPGRLLPVDQAAMADRLIALLPSRSAPADGAPAPNDSQSEAAVNRPPPTVLLMVIAIYICVMFLGQWIAVSRFQEVPTEVAASQTPPSTLGETLPSRPHDRQTAETPK
jgi:hypothetical protein